MTEALRTVTSALTTTLTTLLAPIWADTTTHTITDRRAGSGLDLWLHSDAPRFYTHAINERQFVCRRLEAHCVCCTTDGEAGEDKELCCVGPGHCAPDLAGDCAVVGRATRPAGDPEPGSAKERT
ncbi:uncharacterized protein LOC62_02G002375 [Vanrija pseudolonga]|uniref:Secreted protein n=1 Tax=Vanrija pseudolonga TaxID=143232 RepID=A0AAF1BFX5_9TREE|nr:hypothetical protein LOC62_02G002375 [Vanrija pseudolonga]